MKRLAVLLAGLIVALAGGGQAARAGCSPNHDWQDAAPRWSPDGSRIAFYRVEPGCDLAPRGIWVADARTGTARRLANAARVAAPNPPSWSPDGTRLAFGAAQGIVVQRVAGGEGLDQLTAGRADFAPAWSPDGRVIAFRRGAELWLTAPDGGGPARLPVPRLHDQALPVWAPDSRTLAVAAVAGASTDIHVVDVETSDVRVVAATAANDLGPAWSPDGATIAFASERGSVWTVRPDGTGLAELARGRDPSWSPAGELTWADAEGLRTRRSRLSGFRDVLGAAVWSPGGGRIAFAAGGICLRYGVYVAPDFRLTNRCVRRGTRRGDTIRGSGFRDFVYGYAGNDRLLGGGRKDLLDGGPGDDVLDGDGGWDTLLGREGADLLIGRGDPDLIVGGPGRDRILGGPSGDTIYARDGWRDTIDCGSGRGVDAVHADRHDVVARNCERVSRR